MQKQIDMLVNHNGHDPNVVNARPAESLHKHQNLGYPTPEKDIAVFCGATSSEYAFNMAEHNIAEQDIDQTTHQEMLRDSKPASKHSPYFAEKQAAHENGGGFIGTQQPIKTFQASSACLCEDCTRSLRMLTKAEALRLVDIYEEVVGNLHPFFNQERFKSQVEAVYTALESRQAAGIDGQWNVDSDTMDNIKVVLAIALLALGIGNSDIGTSLYASVQDKVQNAVFSPIKSVKKIVLLLLAVRQLIPNSRLLFVSNAVVEYVPLLL